MNFLDKKIYIVGYSGNMGRRYGAILKHLGVTYSGIDFDKKPDEPPQNYDGFIIASPTLMHARHIQEYANYGRPILCEKPIIKNMRELKHLIEYCREGDVCLTMVNQYYYLQYPGSVGITIYDYFKTGNDTLPWDCINILGLAQGDVYLGNKSPMWTCKINGWDLKLGQIDKAYVDMVFDWLRNPKENLKYIQHAHEAVIGYIETNIGRDRDPSALY